MKMMLFVGDYVQLHNNFLGNDSEWLQVIEIQPYDICVLSNGVHVCASPEYVKAALSWDQCKKQEVTQ